LSFTTIYQATSKDQEQTLFTLFVILELSNSKYNNIIVLH